MSEAPKTMVLKAALFWCEASQLAAAPKSAPLVRGLSIAKWFPHLHVQPRRRPVPFAPTLSQLANRADGYGSASVRPADYPSRGRSPSGETRARRKSK